VKAIGHEIISFPAFRYRKLKDLLKLCSDPKDVDVVLKSVTQLCIVFCDILPSYRIRQYEDAQDKEEAKLSKEVEVLRSQEQFILSCYKEYLQILEVFANVKVSKLSKQTDDKASSSLMYIRLREASIKSFCLLLERHPHFNYRINILQTIASRLSMKDRVIRDICTQTIIGLLRKDDDGLLDFKLDILKEIHKVLRTKEHEHMSPSLLDSLVMHDIIVDETKARAIDESSKKS
jgi:nucleolar complex protein 3